MGRADACAGCGTDLPADARYCVKCGRTRAAPLLDLERVDVAPPEERSVERAVAERRGPRRPRGSVLALVAVVVALVGVVVLLSGGDDGANDGARAPSTTRSSETTRPRPSRTSTTQPPILTGQVGTPGPVLGTPTGGLSLYAVSGSNMVRVELDTGAFTVARNALRLAGSYTSALVVRDGRVVLGRDQQVYVLPADILGEPQRLDGFNLDLGGNVGRLLSMDHGAAPGEPLVVREFDPDGGVLNRWQIPSQAWVVGAVDDRLVVQASGGIYLMGADGEAARHGVGDVMFAGGSIVMWRHCDERLACAIALDDLATGASLPIAVPDNSAFVGYFAQSLAPDGRYAVMARENEPRLIDLATGEERSGPLSNAQPAWSPDGAWLFTVGDDNELIALSTRGLPPIVIPMPDRFILGTNDVMLAVG